MNKNLLLIFAFVAINLQVFAMELTEKEKFNQLVSATFENNISEIQKLIDKKVDILDFTPPDCLPVLSFAGLRHRQISKETFMFLVKNSSHIDSFDSIFETPLTKTIIGGNIDRVKCLVENGADIYKDIGDGRTPYTIALTSMNFFKPSTVLIASYINNVSGYITVGSIEPRSNDNELQLPDYCALAVIKQRTWDIQRLFNVYDISDINTVPYISYYIKLARKRNKPLSLHELALIKIALPHNTKTYTEEYRAHFQKKLFATKDLEIAKNNLLGGCKAMLAYFTMK